MSTRNQQSRRPSHADPFDERIHAAYDRMTPSPEAEDRMLAALLEAQNHRAAASVASQKTNASQPYADTPADHFDIASSDAIHFDGTDIDSVSRTARRRDSSTRRWRIAAISLAACCALVAIGVAGYLGSSDMLNSSLGAASESSASANLTSALPDESTSSESASASGASTDADTPGQSEDATESSDTEANAEGQTQENGESLSVGPTPSPDKDVRYPYVTLSSGETLEIAKVDGERVAAAREDIETPLEEATAFNDIGEETPCYVHESTEGSPYPYVVAFTNSGEMFFAQPTKVAPSD